MTQTILGCTVERTDIPDAPYILHGPRGGIYGLLRYQAHPHLLYAVNLRLGSRAAIVQVKGNRTFTDADGVLTTLNTWRRETT